MSDPIFERVSIRKYEARPVEDEKIRLLVQAGFQAPSGKNQKPWEFYVVTNEEKKKELSTMHPWAGHVADAPLVIVVCVRNHDLIAPGTRHLEGAAATENILLGAVTLGLGACWIGTNPSEELMAHVCKTLDIPDTLEPTSVISIGYPAEGRPQKNRYRDEKVHFVK